MRAAKSCLLQAKQTKDRNYIKSILKEARSGFAWVYEVCQCSQLRPQYLLHIRLHLVQASVQALSKKKFKNAQTDLFGPCCAHPSRHWTMPSWVMRFAKSAQCVWVLIRVFVLCRFRRTTMLFGTSGESRGLSFSFAVDCWWLLAKWWDWCSTRQRFPNSSYMFCQMWAARG